MSNIITKLYKYFRNTIFIQNNNQPIINIQYVREYHTRDHPTFNIIFELFANEENNSYQEEYTCIGGGPTGNLICSPGFRAITERWSFETRKERDEVFNKINKLFVKKIG